MQHSKTIQTKILTILKFKIHLTSLLQLIKEIKISHCQTNYLSSVLRVTSKELFPIQDTLISRNRHPRLLNQIAIRVTLTTSQKTIATKVLKLVTLEPLLRPLPKRVLNIFPSSLPQCRSRI